MNASARWPIEIRRSLAASRRYTKWSPLPRPFSIERIVMPRRYSGAVKRPRLWSLPSMRLVATARRRRDSSLSGLRTTTSMNSRVSTS